MSTEYLQPKSWEELERELERLTDRSVILAGGTDLLPKDPVRKKGTGYLFKPVSVRNARKHRKTGGLLKIGAMATHGQAAENPLVREYFTGLAMPAAG